MTPCPTCHGTGIAHYALDWMLQQAADEALERAAVKIESAPIRQERLGGQTFAYIQRGEIAAAIRAMKGPCGE